MDKQQQANTQEQEQDKAERLKRAAAAAKALSAKKKAQAEAAAATDVASDTASAESKVDTDKGSAKDSGTTTNNGDDKAARLARAAAAAKALSAKKKAAAAAASADKATTDKTESSQDKDKADLSADDKAARLARASAAAKALAAKKKAAAQGQDASEAKADKTADKSDSALTDEEKEARIARAAAAAKALAAKKKAEKAEASTTEEAKADTASTKSPAPAPATQAKAKSTSNASANKESGSNSANNNKALWRSLFAGFILAFIAALCTVGVLLAQHDTNEAIAHNRALQEQQLVRSLLPEIMEREESQGRKVKFECKLISHRLIGHNMRAYIVRNEEDQILGFISSYSTSRGYSNPLILIGGINPQGQISKIDVQLSRETPGIGDKVERRRGNFLDQFDGQNLHSIKWDVKKFGGDFDYITGATVTSRALVLATRDFLEVMATTDLTTLPDCSR
ncbi:MAG TPA: RnfABCDGE type electron transport complex subunit G [Candidatus Anaerobiospirillum pullistercoris]|uniref:RnfABCDGE type electron transport complex subunit G n=1 Tax=Candidatus Anaerobiospirillum pullistercoris TaxID=2838452 RepID=A0A9D1WBT8_9GAMM|nr:RnfABCDGE type electron transport complex subunit G [Candidatus Anaerobiospirillum pullistercoris]